MLEHADRGELKMKSVMISVKPKYCELIASGKKTIEVRKTKPKIETPFKCYIYCTSVKSLSLKEYVEIHSKTGGVVDNWNGKVIGEFVCDEILEYKFADVSTDVSTDVGIFCYYERYITKSLYKPNSLSDCLSGDGLLEYGNYINLYGWHISDLKIYDEPKELNEFYNGCQKSECDDCPYLHFENTPNAYEGWCEFDEKIPIKRPPQSWCYVEELKGD